MIARRSSGDDLAALEKRVTARWIKAISAESSVWPPNPLGTVAPTFVDTKPLPVQWVTYPAKRVAALILADRLMDYELDDSEDAMRRLVRITVCHLMLYGGRERVA